MASQGQMAVTYFFGFDRPETINQPSSLGHKLKKISVHEDSIKKSMKKKGRKKSYSIHVHACN